MDVPDPSIDTQEEAMYRCYLPQPHCRHAGKRHGREQKGHFSQMPSRPKSLLNPGFGGVRRGFAGASDEVLLD